MVGKAEHLTLGVAGEDAAARFLERRGWRIEARNWRPSGARQGLELDVVARHKDSVVFVEVKTRSRKGQGGAGRSPDIPVHAAFTGQKQAKLVRAARCYLAAHDLWNLPCRFDLVCVEHAPDGRWMLEHHINVIELGNFVDSGDASWQPW